MIRKTMILPTLVVAVGMLLAGCAAMLANPYPPVPPMQAETMPKPPVTTTPLIWQPGHWNWDGAAYAWAPGEYVSSEGHTNQWMPGYWKQTDAGWVWQPAHWL